MSLASMLATGSWAPKFTHSTDSKYPASVMWEKDFYSWGEFYRVSNSVLNHPKTSTYELCDCFREDKLFNIQEKSMVENRHFRQYSSPRRGSSADGESFMLQLSYLQYYGPMPPRGHADISLSLPRDEIDYNKYVNEVGKMCPASLLPPNHTAVCKIMEREFHYPRLHALPSRDALWPMTPYCSAHLREVGLKNDFPGFFDDHNGVFDTAVLKRLEPSHLLVSIGWHAPFSSQGKDEARDKEWLRRRIEFARNNFVVPPKPHLKLPQVTWRGNSAFSQFGEYNDRIARELWEETTANAQEDEFGAFGYISFWDLTADLWAIQEWVLEYRSVAFDVTRFLDNSTLGGAEPTTLEEKQIRAAHDLKFRLSPALLRGVSRQAIKIKLATVFLDHAHPQPYVYNELNNAFLNSVCHV